MGQWKEVESNKFTGFLDKSGTEIRIGDEVLFRRKVKAEHHWDRRTGTCTTVPGHYKMVTAKVVGFGRIVKTHYYDANIVIQLEYIQLKELGNFNTFRVYRADNLSIVFDNQ